MQGSEIINHKFRGLGTVTTKQEIRGETLKNIFLKKRRDKLLKSFAEMVQPSSNFFNAYEFIKKRGRQGHFIIYFYIKSFRKILSWSFRNLGTDFLI